VQPGLTTKIAQDCHCGRFDAMSWFLPRLRVDTMEDISIDFIRAMLKTKPRPVGWPQRRVRLDEIGSVWPVADDIKLTQANLGGVGGEWSIAPGSDPGRVLLYFHGGGQCCGSFASHRRLVTEAGRMARIRTLAVDYRLAPEHPFPAAWDDAFTAWRFLLDQGVPANHIVIGGDSAGGGLAAALINRLRNEHSETPACAWLVSPWTDLTLSGSTMEFKSAVDPLLHEAYLNELADAYVPPV